MAKRKRALRRWVVKAGSNMVCTGGPLLLRAWMQQLAQLRREHRIEVIWVTSGAIASAVGRTGFHRKNRRLSEKQALSAIGQPLVMDLYNIALQTSGLLGAQILLTYDDLADRERRRNFQNTVEQLLAWEVTPILNENDAVATQEIQFGDNDSLSAKVAGEVSADKLVILTDVPGLFESDPKRNPRARLLSRVERVTPKLLSGLDRAAGSSKGTGGMYSKLKAAAEASAHGIETHLVQGDHPMALLRIARGEKLGTVIAAGARK